MYFIMDLTTRISKTLKRSTSPILSPNDSGSADSPVAFGDIDIGTPSTSSRTWGEYFAAFTWKGWALIIFILAVLGFNVFTILGKGTQETANVFGPVLKKLASLFVGATGQIVSTGAEGAKAVVGTTADVTTSALDKVQDIATPNPAKRGTEGAAPPQEANHDADGEPQGVHAGKAGWCYVGTDAAFRTCTKVGYDDLCMSGEIFPTQEVCVNPNLRP